MSAPLPCFHPRRALGRTGFVATRLGAGDLADRQVPIEACVATLLRALDAGLNVVDTAPAYEDGYSEEIVGRALRGRRDSVFLVDRIDHLREPVGPQVAASLGRLGVERAAFGPLSEQQLADVRRRAEEAIRGKGRCWWNPQPPPR
jgi:aryl-alcohol dehydrogenase-like predicted oxidoreductase